MGTPQAARWADKTKASYEARHHPLEDLSRSQAQMPTSHHNPASAFHSTYQVI